MSLADLFPDQDYRFQLRFERGEPATYSALLPDAEPLLEEAAEAAAAWHGFAPPQESTSTHDRLLALGEFWEPDFLLLRLDPDGKVRLCGGCVCFPSSWRLTEKVGQPIQFIHGPVPGLNPSIGPSIQRFLSQLKPGVAWLRTNWGLSSSPELNQHPDRGIAPLSASVQLENVWLRVEHQALIALPQTRAILFGIHIAVHPLADVRSEPLAAARLGRALQTMPPEVARYKGLLESRNAITAVLIN